MGKKKFNMDPKKGVEFLVQHGLIRKTPEEVAAFLYKGEGLNKTAIGDYLGEKNDFNEAVLKAFVDLHDFSDLILVQALRQFLWSFRFIRSFYERIPAFSSEDIKIDNIHFIEIFVGYLARPKRLIGWWKVLLRDIAV